MFTSGRIVYRGHGAAGTLTRPILAPTGELVLDSVWRVKVVVAAV